MLKLVGRICVNIDAETFVEAGAHQAALEELKDLVRQRYPGAVLEFSQRRERRALGLAPPPEVMTHLTQVGGQGRR